MRIRFFMCLFFVLGTLRSFLLVRFLFHDPYRNTEDDEGRKPDTGMPRWLIYGFLAKLALVVLITLAIVWFASR